MSGFKLCRPSGLECKGRFGFRVLPAPRPISNFLLVACYDIWRFPRNWGVPFGGGCHKDDSIMGSIVRSPFYGNYHIGNIEYYWVGP